MRNLFTRDKRKSEKTMSRFVNLYFVLNIFLITLLTHFRSLIGSHDCVSSEKMSEVYDLGRFKSVWTMIFSFQLEGNVSSSGRQVRTIHNYLCLVKRFLSSGSLTNILLILIFSGLRTVVTGSLVYPTLTKQDSSSGLLQKKLVGIYCYYF